MRPFFVGNAPLALTIASLVAAHRATAFVEPARQWTLPCVAATTATRPVRDLEPVSLRFQGNFTAAQHTTRITSTLDVSRHPAGGWAVVERAVLPRGLAVDSARLEANSLVVRERNIAQAPIQITLRFSDKKMVGTITRKAETRRITMDLCEPIIGDGSGAFLVISRLALAAGYHTTLPHVDIQAGKVTVRQLVVLGTERLVVAAGDFDTWKVLVRDEDGTDPTTIWVDRRSAIPVKFSTSQGAVTISMELTEYLRRSGYER